MTEKLTQRFSNYLVSMQAASADNGEIIAYGLFHILSSGIQIVLLAVTAWLFGNALQVLAFTLCFTSLKCYAGGAHARKHWSCLMTYTVMAQSICLLCRYVLINMARYWAIPVSALALVLVIWKAPITHPNNPKPKRKRKRYRKLALFIATIQLVLISILCLLFPVGNEIIFSGTLGELAAATTLILPMLPEGKEAKNENAL